MAELSALAQDLLRLEAELKRLEAEYNMFFAGRLPKPPSETRGRVEAIVRRYDRAFIQNYAERFRFSTLQSRFSALVDLWDRGLRAREEGRAGPLVTRRTDPSASPPPRDRILHVATFNDPMREMDRLEELYGSLIEARRELGQDAVPFDRFAELVKTQVTKLQRSGTDEVAFRVAVKDGKVSFTARAMKGSE